jgi:hypothetical protein
MGTREYIQNLIKADIADFYDDPDYEDAKSTLDYFTCMLLAAREYGIDFEQYVNDTCTAYEIKRVDKIITQCARDAL